MKDVGQRSDRMTEVAGLKHALPYLRLFQGKTFVIKLSGEAIAEKHDTFAPLKTARDSNFPDAKSTSFSGTCAHSIISTVGLCLRIMRSSSGSFAPSDLVMKM